MAAPSQESLFRTENSDIPLLAEVIIPVALPQNYTWSVPASMRDQVQIGIRVEVNLGARRRYAGIIKRLHTDKPDFKPKPIIQVLDDHPIVTETQLIFWTWIAQYYLCTEGEVMSAALPTNFKLSSETWLRLLPAYGEDFTALEDAEYLLAEALSIKKQLRRSEAQLILQNKQVYSIIHRLVELGIAELVESLQEKYASRLDTFISLHPTYQDETTLADLLNGGLRAPKQLELLLAYLDLKRDNDSITRTTLLKRASSTAAPLQALIEKEILIAEKRSVGRITRPEAFVKLDFTLSSYQETALQSIRSQWNQQDVCLIRGVTGSGKTHLYIQLIADAIQQGRQVLYLLPEIALTSQIIRRLQQHFGGGVGVYHSRFSGNERVEIWNEVRSGKIRVMLGARSALFLPFTDLGLIICDEEHDASFKQQEGGFRYSARDLALVRAQQLDIPIVLGSATPSLESLHNVTLGRFHHLSLPRRAGNAQPPTLKLIDLRAEHVHAGLSTTAATTIEKHLADQGQVLVYINRRGYAPTLACTACGWVAPCLSCDARLTVYRHAARLRCHHCGADRELPRQCPQCGYAVKTVGQGTERIEESLAETFQGIGIARLDRDVVRRQDELEAVVSRITSGDARILVGTQMIAKGHDFPDVTLVVVLNADQGLFSTDFRAAERLAQTIVQVAGRAGRGDRRGEVLIQTEYPEHPLLRGLLEGGYEAFASAALAERESAAWPPFARLAALRASALQADWATDFLAAARRAAPKANVRLLGPAPAAMAKRAGRFHAQLLIESGERAALHRFLDRWVPAVEALPEVRRVRWALDVDPLELF